MRGNDRIRDKYIKLEIAKNEKLKPFLNASVATNTDIIFGAVHTFQNDSGHCEISYYNSFGKCFARLMSQLKTKNYKRISLKEFNEIFIK